MMIIGLLSFVGAVLLWGASDWLSSLNFGSLATIVYIASLLALLVAIGMGLWSDRDPVR